MLGIVPLSFLLPSVCCLIYFNRQTVVLPTLSFSESFSSLVISLFTYSWFISFLPHNFYFSSSSLFVNCPSGKTCSHFSADRDSRSQLNPAKCTQEGQNKYEDTCKVVCNHGNVLKKPAAEITTCGKDGLWVPHPSYCIGKGGEVALTQEMI